MAIELKINAVPRNMHGVNSSVQTCFENFTKQSIKGQLMYFVHRPCVHDTTILLVIKFGTCTSSIEAEFHWFDYFYFLMERTVDNNEAPFFDLQDSSV